MFSNRIKILIFAIILFFPLMTMAGPHPPRVELFCSSENWGNQELLNIKPGFYYDTVYQNAQIQKYVKTIDSLEIIDWEEKKHKVLSNITNKERREILQSSLQNCDVEISSDELDVIERDINFWVEWIEDTDRTSELFLILPYSKHNEDMVSVGGITYIENEVLNSFDLDSKRVGNLLLVYSNDFSTHTFQKDNIILMLLSLIILIFVGGIGYYNYRLK